MTLDLKLIFVLLAFVAYGNAADPEVQTPLGRIQGSYMTSVQNKSILAFRGVRYAKSTAGERRFKIAEPVDAWTDIYNATVDGPSCSLYDTADIASEDCLMLNVYTTKLSSTSEQVKRPVIVFFHPSAYQSGSARSILYGPEYLLDEDVVLVTVNSRLATFGFISTGDARAPGNLGLKDQVFALRWIQKNIAAFGGDPNSVTLSACSAGAVGAILHMLSPMSKGLFHRVVASSGAPDLKQAFSTNETDKLLAQARLLNCSTVSVDAALECLKTVPRQQYADAMLAFYLEYGVNIWVPVVEPEDAGVERFLTAQPVDLIKQGSVAEVPLILGNNKDEFLGSLVADYEAAVKGDDSAFRNLTANWDTTTPKTLTYEKGTERSTNISHQLKKFYFNDEAITVNNSFNLADMWKDGVIGFVEDRTAKLLTQYSKATVYYYMFTYQGSYSNAVWTDTKKPVGVVHMDDLLYYLTTKSSFPVFNETYPEYTMVKKMTSLLANFANTGKPIPQNNELFTGVTWDAFNLQNENYLEIGATFTTKSKMYSERYAFWESVFPLA